jgi:hypothetical protein
MQRSFRVSESLADAAGGASVEEEVLAAAIGPFDLGGVGIRTRAGSRACERP